MKEGTPFATVPGKMVSRGVAVAAAVAVMLSVMATASAEPGLFKKGGGCRPHVEYVPHYTTLLQKVSGACSDLRD